MSVVNCFHFSVSLGYKTTYIYFTTINSQLWIAFIFQYLWDTKQHYNNIYHINHSCELLSFFSIFGIQNNNHVWTMIGSGVVNCFHFSVSLGYKTTLMTLLHPLLKLWIAFIFQYLWDTKQHFQQNISRFGSCELLSFFSIFGIQNNDGTILPSASLVVNCFHFSVSLGYKTTFSLYSCCNLKLWIAFIFQYLWDTKQLENFEGDLSLCCELLSFFSIFGIQNNCDGRWFQETIVVNCFHFSVSLGYKTTNYYKNK